MAAPPIDLDYVSRRVKRHLNDLERSNYTEPAAATAGVNAAQQEEAELAKGMTALARDAAGEEGKGMLGADDRLRWRRPSEGHAD